LTYTWRLLSRRFYALTRALRLLPIGILAPTVLPALTPSTITLIASPNASQFGQAVILTATVTAGATGKVTFYDDVTVLGVAKLAAGQATLTSAALPSGGTMLRTYYNGDNSYSPSISALVPQTVTAGISLGFHTALKQTITAPDFTLAIADFNGDGIADLVTANYNTGNVSIFLGNGDGTFRAGGTIPVDSPNAVLVADFNGDGKADLAVSNNYNGTVSILLGNGDGTFAAPVPYKVGSNPWYLASGDFNGDGNADLVAANLTGTNSLSSGAHASPLGLRPARSCLAFLPVNAQGKRQCQDGNTGQLWRKIPDA